MNFDAIDNDIYADYHEEVVKLTQHLAVIDPDLVQNLNVEWNEDDSIQINKNHQHDLYNVVKEYKAFTERTFLISERKHYILINTLARTMLSKGTNHFEFLDIFPLESFRIKNIDKAYDLIVDMHQEWMDKEDLSLLIPPALDPNKKQIVESYLQTIRSLNLEDESEGTLAYLLNDYCRTMILYDCVLQIAYGTDLKTIIRVYGDYTEKALILYNAQINNLEGGNEIEIICSRKVFDCCSQLEY